ncbi:MAG: hypothetical protein QXF70_03500 [Candidatus Bilamarchaeaceae archaeon]
MKKALLTYSLIFLFGFITAWLSYIYFIEFSSFPMAILKSIFGIFIFWLIDRFALHELDTIEELKKGNIAYALFVLGICVIIAVAVGWA